MDKSELEKLKAQLLANLELYSNFYVGLISIGKHVYLHDLESPFLSELVISG